MCIVCILVYIYTEAEREREREREREQVGCLWHPTAWSTPTPWCRRWQEGGQRRCPIPSVPCALGLQVSVTITVAYLAFFIGAAGLVSGEARSKKVLRGPFRGCQPSGIEAFCVSYQITSAFIMAKIMFWGHTEENELHVSGVLAAIFAALMMSKYAKPLVCHKESWIGHEGPITRQRWRVLSPVSLTCVMRNLTQVPKPFKLTASLGRLQDGMDAVWHAMEYFGNTILFVLCGLFAYESFTKVAWEDFGWLILLYILANFARAFMVALLWPIVNLVGGSDVTPLAYAATLSCCTQLLHSSSRRKTVEPALPRKTTWKECAV